MSSTHVLLIIGKERASNTSFDLLRNIELPVIAMHRILWLAVYDNLKMQVRSA